MLIERRYDPLALTPRQRDFLNTIERLTRDRGFPPTIAEASRALNLHPSRGASLVWTLARKGALTREPRIPRSLRVVRPAADAADPAKGTSQHEHGR
jgi:SOS-response transcriptional repressor LexA